MPQKTYSEIGEELGLTPFEVMDAEKRGLYKILLFLFDDVDCDFDALAELLDTPPLAIQEAFLSFYLYTQKVPSAEDSARVSQKHDNIRQNVKPSKIPPAPQSISTTCE